MGSVISLIDIESLSKLHTWKNNGKMGIESFTLEDSNSPILNCFWMNNDRMIERKSFNASDVVLVDF